MTLLYHDSSPGPKTHVFIVGVGRFPFLKGQSQELFDGLRHVEDVTSPPNNAYAMVDLLAAAAQELIPPLGSIEVLISEENGSAATIPRGSHRHEARADGAIEPATGERVEQALLRWVPRCEEDEENLALFFGSSHGMQAQEHVLLLEDACEKPHKPWENMLSVNHLHRNLYRKKNRRSMIFVDCCRDLLREGEDSLDSFSGRSIGTTTNEQLVKAKSDPARVVYVLRASPLGAVATATKNGLGYFTEALRLCLTHRCAAGIHRPGVGWSVSPENLREAVENAGRFGLDFTEKELRPVEEDSNWVGGPFLKLEGMPSYPIRVREASKSDLGRARLSLSNQGCGFGVHRDPDLLGRKALCSWVQPRMEPYEAAGEIPAVGATLPVPLRTETILVSTLGFDVPLSR